MKAKRNKFRIEFYHKKGRKDVKQKFRWNIVALNGRIVCSSESFLHKTGPIKTVKSLISAIKKDQIRLEKEYIIE